MHGRLLNICRGRRAGIGVLPGVAVFLMIRCIVAAACQPDVGVPGVVAACYVEDSLGTAFLVTNESDCILGKHDIRVFVDAWRTSPISASNCHVRQTPSCGNRTPPS